MTCCDFIFLILSLFFRTLAQGVHSIVKLNTTCDKKNKNKKIYFLHKASPKWVKALSIFFYE